MVTFLTLPHIGNTISALANEAISAVSLKFLSAFCYSFLLETSSRYQSFKSPMQNGSAEMKSPNPKDNTGIKDSSLPTNNRPYKIKWIQTTSRTDQLQWKPVFILRSSAPNRKDCKYFIGKSTGNQYKTYHLDELHDYPDSKCSKTQIINTMLQSLHTLFIQTTINEEDETPLYLYRRKPSDSGSLFSLLNIFNKNNECLSLDPIHDCEFHESSYGIDEYDQQVTGVWVKTDQQTEKTYMSIDKIKTISYIDDVNPVEYKPHHNQDKPLHPYALPNDEVNLTQQVEELQHRNNDLLKLIEDLKADNNGKQKQNEILSLQMNDLKRTITAPKKTNHDKTHKKIIMEQKQCLEDKQNEIDRLRRELIARSNARELSSKFLTIEEVCSEYQSIKNQEFQSVHSKLSKPMRKQHKDWNKGYINKLSHKLLFGTLCKCYEATLKFHDDIYTQIGDVLQIQYLNKGSQAEVEGKTEQNGYGHGNKGNETLDFLFHRYLTNNYETLKESKGFNEMIDGVWMNGCGEYESVMDVLSDEEQDEVKGALKVFVRKCCDICWCMVLQRPMLSISPFEFVPKERVEFDETTQKRIMGSSRKDKCVLYFV
eukprot:85312_1